MRKNIIQPNPVISHGVPAFCGNVSSDAAAANNADYHSFWESSSPDYIAFDLSAVPENQRETVIAVWYNESTYDNIGNYVSKSAVPTDYTIEVNSSAGDKFPEKGWVTAISVTDNPLSSRQHILRMKGFNWIRMNISRSDSTANCRIKLNLDIHDVSDGVSDSWLFLGDSITACGMNNCYGTGFASHIHAVAPCYFPVQENGGIGGTSSVHGKENIHRWLSMYEGRFVSIAYGTNDAWGNYTGAENYYANIRYIIDTVIASGKIPVLPTIPHASANDVGTYLPDYNSMVKRLWAEYGESLIQGADLESFIRENPHYLSADGVHPTAEGYEAIRRFWALSMQKLYDILKATPHKARLTALY